MQTEQQTLSTQVVTLRRTFRCGQCGGLAELTHGAPNRLTFLRCQKCSIEEGTLSQTFGAYPFHYFDVDVESVSV